MAFLQADPSGDLFLNITQSVGRRKSNTPEDVLVVQALLAIIYNRSPPFQKRRPGNRPVVVSSELGSDTTTLIADFQRTILKRPKPQGFCDRAPVSSSTQLNFNTLFRLWGTADQIHSVTSSEDLLVVLQRENPSLRNLRRVGETGNSSPREPRAPRVIDSSR